jgi:hypothetical protein
MFPTFSRKKLCSGVFFDDKKMFFHTTLNPSSGTEIPVLKKSAGIAYPSTFHTNSAKERLKNLEFLVPQRCWFDFRVMHRFFLHVKDVWRTNLVKRSKTYLVILKGAALT